MASAAFPLELSLFYFGADSESVNRYEVLLETARYADLRGFTAVWLPERHFMQFGGIYCSPSVLAAAVAATTNRIGIRAGSVVLSLRDPIRVAEEWAIVDNLSGGRVAVAAASGWLVNDFVLDPDSWPRRREVSVERLDLVRRLWRGEAIAFPNGEGKSVPVSILPRPIQPELPIWWTTTSAEGFRQAGDMGLNVLTSNFGHGYNAQNLKQCVDLYRAHHLRASGTPGHVTLMVHTYAAETADEIASVVRPAMTRYVATNVEMQVARDEGRGKPSKVRALSDRGQEALVALAAASNIVSPLSFIGTKNDLEARANFLSTCGVDELACLVDFGPTLEQTMQSVTRLSTLLA